MANSGNKANAIVTFYYPGATVVSAYSTPESLTHSTDQNTEEAQAPNQAQSPSAQEP